MENVKSSKQFLWGVISEIKKRDKLHAKTLLSSMSKGSFFDYLCDVVYKFFIFNKTTSEQVAEDYLRMVYEMRRESIYFEIYGEYSCKSEKEAYEKVYSKKEVMSYYMNALIISVLLWRHHFDMLEYFMKSLEYYQGGSGESILDVGAGHGLFSKMIQEYMPNHKWIDVVDLSSESLEMSKAILGPDVTYYQDDIVYFNTYVRYDVIILSEVLEHLDRPFEVLDRIVKVLLHSNGHIWITIPINAPAIDHISLFKSKEEVYKLVEDAGLEVIVSHITEANNLTHLVGVFCEKK